MLNIAMHKIVVSRAWDEIPWEELPHRLDYISTRLNTLSLMLLDITDVFLILTLFELGNGFLLCLTDKRSSVHLVVRYITLVPSGVVLNLTIATYIKSYSIWTDLEELEV